MDVILFIYMRPFIFLAAALSVIPLRTLSAQNTLDHLLYGARALDIHAVPLPPVPVSDVETAGPHVTLLLNADRSNQARPVWPGYSVFGQPVLLYEAGVRSFLIAHPNPPAGYSEVFSAPRTVFGKAGEIPDLNFPFQFHRKVNRIDTFAYRYEPGDRPERSIRTLVHERFHVFQEKAFAAPAYNGRVSEPDAEDLALAALEQKTLKSALLASGRAEAARFAGQFLAVRAERYSRQPDSRDHEVDEERTEGMALYIEENLMDRPDVAPTAQGVISAVVRRLDRFPGMDDMEKGRYYGTGAAQGLLLDLAAQEGWKQRVAAGASLRDLLAGAYPLAAADIPAVLEDAKDWHGYDALLKTGIKLAGEFQSLKAKAISDYESSPGVEWKVQVPWDKDTNFGFSGSNPDFRLNETETLMPNLDTLDVRGTAFTLHFEARPAVLGSGVRFHASPEAVVLLDGAAFSLSDGVYHFESLALTEADLNLDAARPGTLTVLGRKTVVSFVTGSGSKRSLLK